MRIRFRLSESESFRIGPFRFRFRQSVPIGRGRAWQSGTVRLGPLSLRESGPVGGNHRRRSRR
jgi:hypothetical protein